MEGPHDPCVERGAEFMASFFTLIYCNAKDFEDVLEESNDHKLDQKR